MEKKWVRLAYSVYLSVLHQAHTERPRARKYHISNSLCLLRSQLSFKLLNERELFIPLPLRLLASPHPPTWYPMHNSPITFANVSSGFGYTFLYFYFFYLSRFLSLFWPFLRVYLGIVMKNKASDSKKSLAVNTNCFYIEKVLIWLRIHITHIYI